MKTKIASKPHWNNLTSIRNLKALQTKLKNNFCKLANQHFREFMIVLFASSTGSIRVKLRQIFRIFDKDKNGLISREELNKISKDLFHLYKSKGDPDKGKEVSFGQNILILRRI